MKPDWLKTKIFLDGCDPKKTKDLIDLGLIPDGQTTNPTLVARSPRIKERLDEGEKLMPRELLDSYRDIVQEISKLIPYGSISIEVYADMTTSCGYMLHQAREMNHWIPNAHIKFPLTREGLKASRQALEEGIRVNITLCFNQEQAQAVYAATLGAKKGDVFLSPFVGRLDDIGLYGLGLIKNIMRQYGGGDGHVQVLSASVRNMHHMLESIKLGADIVTCPFKILEEWINLGYPREVSQLPSGLKSMEFEDIYPYREWHEFNLDHELTTNGIARFVDDWNGLLKAREDY